MADNCQNNDRRFEPVCIDVSRVYDSCADRDCLSDLRVILTEEGQTALASATGVRCRSVDVINVFSEIEQVPFSAGYYSVDATYFFDVGLDVYTDPLTAPASVHGLTVVTKKSILYGGTGSVKVFSSEYSPSVDVQNPSYSTNPRAKIQVATPIPLDARLCLPSDCVCEPPLNVGTLPESVRRRFSGELVVAEDAAPAVRVTVGLFSITRLERDVQLLIPSYDFCMPTKECDTDAEDPCDAFRRISFPVNEFFPPDEAPEDASGACRNTPTVNERCGCGR